MYQMYSKQTHNPLNLELLKSFYHKVSYVLFLVYLSWLKNSSIFVLQKWLLRKYFNKTKVKLVNFKCFPISKKSRETGEIIHYTVSLVFYALNPTSLLQSSYRAVWHLKGTPWARATNNVKKPQSQMCESIES